MSQETVKESTPKGLLATRKTLAVRDGTRRVAENAEIGMTDRYTPLMPTRVRQVSFVPSTESREARAIARTERDTDIACARETVAGIILSLSLSLSLTLSLSLSPLHLLSYSLVAKRLVDSTR